jgi:hypothetical protein
MTSALGQVLNPARPSPIPAQSSLRFPRGMMVNVMIVTVTVGTRTLSRRLILACGKVTATAVASE